MIYRFTGIVGFAVAFFLGGCSAKIVFTEPQPVGIETASAIPEKFHGNYEVLDPKTGKKSKFIDAPRLRISADSIVFTEYKSNSVHKNFVDGASYKLIDNHLYRDGEKLSLFPVTLKGDEYHYVSASHALAMGVCGTLQEQVGNDTVFFDYEIRTSENYFVCNMRAIPENDDNLEYGGNWIVFVFMLQADGKLVLHFPPSKSAVPGGAKDDFNGEMLMSEYNAVPVNDYFVVDLENSTQFNSLRNKYFETLLEFVKI